MTGRGQIGADGGVWEELAESAGVVALRTLRKRGTLWGGKETRSGKRLHDIPS